MNQLLTYGHSAAYQMTALTTGFLTLIAGCAMLSTRRLIASDSPLPVRPRRRLALRRALGLTMVGVGLCSVACTLLRCTTLGTLYNATLTSAVMLVMAYAAFAMLKSRWARMDIAVGNAAMTLIFPVLYALADSDLVMQDAIATVAYCYLALQVGIYIAAFCDAWTKCGHRASRRYAVWIFAPAMALGICSAIAWMEPSIAASVTLMIASAIYMLSITSIFIRHTYSKRRI